MNFKFKLRKEDIPDDPTLDRVKSSADQLNRFVSSTVWQDMSELITLQIEHKHVLLETAPPEELKGIQETIHALKFVLSLPEMLLEARESEDEERKQRGEETEG